MGAGEPVEGKLLGSEEMMASPVVAVVVESEPMGRGGDADEGEPVQFWAACCSTYLCHMVGLVYALVFANTRTGRVGALTGLQLSTLKVALLALCAALTASSMTEFREFRPAAVRTPAACNEVGGAWVLRSSAEAEPAALEEGDAQAEWHRRHGRRHGHHGEGQLVDPADPAKNFCNCPRLSLQRAQDGEIVCSSAVVPLVAFGVVYLLAFTMLTVARFYL